MPKSEKQMNRKRLLSKYLEGYLSEKSKIAAGFPPGEVQRDFNPFDEQYDNLEAE